MPGAGAPTRRGRLVRLPEVVGAEDRERPRLPLGERNPAADRVPVLGPDDLACIGYDDALDRKRAAYCSRRPVRAV